MRSVECHLITSAKAAKCNVIEVDTTERRLEWPYGNYMAFSAEN